MNAMMYREMHLDGIAARVGAPAAGRLLSAWETLVARYGHAPFAPFDPHDLGELADDLLVLAPTGDGEFVHVHCGDAIARKGGVDLVGRLTSDIGGEVGEFLLEVYAKAFDLGLPVYAVHESPFSAHVRVWERLVLPCRDADGNDAIVVYAKPLKLQEDISVAVIEASPHGVMVVKLAASVGGPAGATVVLANRRARALCGAPDADLIGRDLFDLLPAIAAPTDWDTLAAIVADFTPNHVVIHHETADASRWIEIAGSPFGEGLVLTLSDVTARVDAETAAEMRQMDLAAANEALIAEVARRKELEAELTRLATLDPLTGAVNRRVLTEKLQQAMALSERYGHAVSIVMVDLDLFKRINDVFGHAGGDAVLKAAAQIMRHGCREDVDVVGRMGGEEFVAVLPHTSIEGAAAVAERLRRQFTAAEVTGVDGRVIPFTGSFGVASWDGLESLDRFMARADDALYKAKASGRNIVVVDMGGGDHAPIADPARIEAPLAPEVSPEPPKPTARRTRRAPNKDKTPAL